MAQLAGAPRGPQRNYLLFYVSIKKKAKASQEPAAGTETSKKCLESQKAAPEVKEMPEDVVQQHRMYTSEESESDSLRGVRKRPRKRQRSRGSFTTTKQPLPAFFLFMAQHRSELQKSNPHWTAAETAMKLGKIWHEQSEREKEMYKQQAAQLRGQNQGRRA